MASPPDSRKPLPRYLRRPGDDGYRTPTIEDIEKDARQRPAFPFEENANGSYMPDSGSVALSPTTEVNAPAEKQPQQPSAPPERSEQPTTSLSWKQRLQHLTWAYFTLTMATGGIANVLYTVPYPFTGLKVMGNIFFIGNMVAYIVICILMVLRFYWHPYAFKASFLHPTESLFVPAVAVSFGTILINISQYGLSHVGPWLNRVVETLFWFDATLAIILSISVYLLLWSTQYFSVARMTPIWIFPAYPLLIIGPHAGVLSTHLSPERALPIIIGGFTIQGVGFLVSLMVYSAFIYRLMTQKLPRESLRPGMFVSVGPSGFTVAGVVNMASNLENILPTTKMFMNETDGQLVATILKICADWMCLWLWGLAIWFFFVSVLAHLTAFLPQSTADDRDYTDLSDHKKKSHPISRTSLHFRHPQMAFSMTFFSFVFPNTALVTATFAIASAFNLRAVRILGCVMTCLLILTWLFVVIGMVRAIKTHVILWPEKGEDRDEGGFKMKNQISESSSEGMLSGRNNNHHARHRDEGARDRSASRRRRLTDLGTEGSNIIRKIRTSESVQDVKGGFQRWRRKSSHTSNV